MRLPIGYSDFKEVVDQQFDFVDKTLMIKEVIEDAKVILITRPRRFGKTLNMTMLRYFFEQTTDSNACLFEGLNIAAEKEWFAKHQGQYSVIFVSFKEIKESSFKDAYDRISATMAEVYDEFSDVLLNSDKLTALLKRQVNKILEGRASRADIKNSLRILSKCLYKHYGKPVYILIDEYDTPIQSGYLNGYYEKIVELFRGLFGAGLKDNTYLFKAVLTGILRVSKESLFSGLNNLSVYSVLQERYSQYFGFTESEVAALLHQAKLDEKSGEIKHWYNGYQFGSHTMYNPWSMINCIRAQGVLEPYWVNTSDNALIKNLLLKSSTAFKERFELLLQGNVIERLVNENFVFLDLKQRYNESVIWSLLLMTGYLKINTFQRTDQGSLCQLAIPNREIRNLYREIIEQWLSDGYGVEWYNEFLGSLLSGDMVAFEHGFKCLLEQTVSSHDVSSQPEAFYHGLVIGMTASLHDRGAYEIRSNRESGDGRYDYMILSRDLDKLTILFEFKKVKSVAMLKKSAQAALKQMKTLSYFAEAKQRGITKILKIGIAFCGKRFSLVWE